MPEHPTDRPSLVRRVLAPRRLLYIGIGLLATLAGMAAGHFTASLLHPDSSPVLAVGSTVIDHTPTPMKEWAISHFGSNDKKVLIGSVLAGVLVLAAVAGLLTLRRFVYGAVLTTVLVLVAGAAVVSRPEFSALDVVPTIVTLIAGLASLTWLDRSYRSYAAASTVGPANERTVGSPAGTTDTTSTTTSATTSATTGSTTGSTKPRTVLEGGPDASRRGVLIAGGVLAVAAAVLAGAGRYITGRRARPEDVTLPEPTSPAPAFPAGVDEPGITPLRIANADFYRVDTRLDTPVVDSSSWTLTVDGDVANKLEISFDDLLAMDTIERDITLTCVSNSVGGPFVGGARWLGVPLKTILDMAGVGDTADQMLATDFDGMTISTPLEIATDGRDAMLAFGMNGVQLPREHGFPVRVIVPGLYGFISATKWVTRLTLTTYAEEQAYWTKKKWDTKAPIKPSARIDTPAALANIPSGKTVIGGVAWAQFDDGVKTVQVQIDGGPWQDATMGPDVDNVYWRQWYTEWDAKSGSHNVSARVIDGKGQVQTAARAEPFPGGSSGIHQLIVTVA